ncbi:MAG: hypothetical protein ACTSPA_12170, partial [Promethearchaeota archaeon]
MPNVKKKTIQNLKKKISKKTSSETKNIKGKKTSKKTTKKKSTKSKKSTKKMEKFIETNLETPKKLKNEIDLDSQVHISKKAKRKTKEADAHELNTENKDNLVARHLLRLYQFIKQNDPINEQKLLEEMDKGTPNEELRLKITQLDLEIESIYEENHALRQNALQTQIEAEDQIESTEFENRELKEKVQEINVFVKEKRFEIIIEDLRARLREALEKNEKITEVNERIEYMQKQVTTFFDKNENLTKQHNKLDQKYVNLTEKYEESQSKNQKLETKNKELHKKVELQKLVIDG